MSLFWALVKKGRFRLIPRAIFLAYATYWEFPDVMLAFKRYVNRTEEVLSESHFEGMEYRSIWMIRQAHRRLDIRYHWTDRGRHMDVIKTVEHRRFLENYERAKITMARNTFNWNKFPGHSMTYYPSFNPPHPECLPEPAMRFMGQYPIYDLRTVEGLQYDLRPERLKDIINPDKSYIGVHKEFGGKDLSDKEFERQLFDAIE